MVPRKVRAHWGQGLRSGVQNCRIPEGAELEGVGPEGGAWRALP